MSIFNTTANTNFNAFQDPLNPVNTNRGPWGIDPNYLTPSYNAPYRPPYTGSTAGPLEHQNPGGMRSAWNLVSPFNPGPQFAVGNNQQESAYFDALNQRGPDFGSSIVQRVGIPIAGFGLSYGLERMWRTQSPVRWTRGNPVSGFTGAGQRFGMGVSNSMFKAFDPLIPNISTSGFARASANLAGLAGGLAGSVAGTLGVTAAVQTAFEKTVADPYIAIRENQNMLRQSFSGVSFAGSDRDTATGRGLSRSATARMGTQLAQIGARDQIFSGREVASLTSMAAQTGMLDSVSSDQMTQRMGSIVKQVKVVMSLMGSKDFQEVMGSMAKLYAGGVGANSIDTSMARISALAGSAGISTQRLMNTVGAQGQYLFQSNGLTPYLGQMTSATSIAGFGSAYRTGLMSPEMMARLGGVEGATQLSSTAQLNASQTVYNSVRAYNKYITGDGGHDVVSNMSNLGARAAGDPLFTMGQMVLSRGRALSEQFKREGFMGTHNQIMEIGEFLPGIMKNGRIKGEHAAAIMTNMMGMSSDEAQAYLMQYHSYQDPRTANQQIAGMQSKKMETMRDLMEQQGLGPLASRFGGVAADYRKFIGGSTSMLGGMVTEGSGLMDTFSRKWNEFNMGGTESEVSGFKVSDLDRTKDIRSIKLMSEERGMTGMMTEGPGLAFIRRNFSINPRDRYEDEMRKINELARSGNQHAIDALGSDSVKARNGLRQLALGGHISESLQSGHGLDELHETLVNSPRNNSGTMRDEILGKFDKGLSGMDDVMKGAGSIEKLAGAGIATDLLKTYGYEQDAGQDRPRNCKAITTIQERDG
jgi:hypothetical protein